ncbi:MAG: ankyrin repeat domain-containing protein [Roseibacillus sp.]|nr:ankyrin repeat domain-containing protein [Roseibacillus sp.]
MKYFIPLCVALVASCLATAAPSKPAAVGHPSFLSPHARPVALNGEHVFVTNTPADTVDVIDRKTRRIVRRIPVGIDPVGLALRPDGKELWVSNHVSDSVSVINLEKRSPTRFHVVATVQDLDPRTKATRFDEPVGIAFASNEKAYVALSSENKIAVVNVKTRKVEKRLNITAQDPRAIVVRGDRLYVIPFESNNKTQLSGGYKIDGDLVTFNAHEHSIANNNVLSLGHVTDIVKHPRVPDRDLYVFDTRTDRLIETVDTLGTLLYGLTVDSKGRVFIAQADARNDANGRSGTKKHGLAELENRAFLNQITRVLPGEKAKPEFFDLEPLPPKHPEREKALATPYAIQISGDDSTLVASAAGSDIVFTVDVGSGSVLGRVRVGSVPRGIALEPGQGGKLSGAWTLNAVANTVSLLNLSDPDKPRVEDTITLEDPTHPAFKRGRIAFNKASASTTATFSCASCHPDGHTDQLLWVLKTPIVTGGDQIMPRSTMPVRGLRDTAPFHWDGIPGDPYGGNNSANIRSHVDPNCDPDKPESATRHLIDGGLATTMLMLGSKETNDEGKVGHLSSGERDDMAKFLLNVTYPPAQRRAYDNKLTERAEEGFKQFHIVGNREDGRMNVCGNCHRMPFLVSTNTPGTGMDAPTWRGAYDRFLILPQGRLNIIDFDFYRRVAERGNSEREIWRFSWRSRNEFDPVWEMVTEGSTGFSGSFARQLTLNRDTAREELTGNLLEALETSAREGAIVLQCEGVIVGEGKGRTVTFQYDAQWEGGSYVMMDGERKAVTREKLVEAAAAGSFVGTITGRHGVNDDYDHPQPALWTRGSLQAQIGKQRFPRLYGENRTMIVGARHIRKEAAVFVNGRRVPARITLPRKERATIELQTLPEPGIHFLQVQNPSGLFSNDFIFYTGKNEEEARNARSSADPSAIREDLAKAIERNDLDAVKRWIRKGAPTNARRLGDGGMTPLSTAVFHGRMEIARLLVEEHKVGVSYHNRDGNTPLHLAAFLCREDMVEFLLRHGASLTKKNDREEAAVDTVSGGWSDGLRQFYEGIIRGSNLGLDVKKIEKQRPVVARMLRERASGKK